MNKLVVFWIATMYSMMTVAEVSFSELTNLSATPDALQGEFNQIKYLKSIDVSLNSSGKFVYLRDKSLRWEILEPVQNELILTPNSMLNKQGEQTLANIDAASNPSIAMVSHIFFSVLTADWEALEAYFEITNVVEESEWLVELTPVEDLLAQVMTSVELSGSKYLNRIVMNEKAGNITTIHFNEQQSIFQEKTNQTDAQVSQ